MLSLRTFVVLGLYFSDVCLSDVCRFYVCRYDVCRCTCAHRNTWVTKTWRLRYTVSHAILLVFTDARCTCVYYKQQYMVGPEWLYLCTAPVCSLGSSTWWALSGCTWPQGSTSLRPRWVLMNICFSKFLFSCMLETLNTVSNYKFLRFLQDVQ